MERSTESRFSIPEFFAPAPLLTVGLMALNDRWLKPTFHNALTGKLSDLAGCFFFPLFLSALLAFVTPWTLRTRVHVGAVTTVLLFGAIKVSPRCATGLVGTLELITRPLGIGPLRIVVDPTDLVALTLTAFAVLYGRRLET